MHYLQNFHLDESDGIDLVIQGLEYYDQRDGHFFSPWSFKECVLKKDDFLFAFAENKLMEVGFPVGKAYSKKLLDLNNLRFDTRLSFHEDHIFVLDYYMLCHTIRLVDAIDYKYFIEPNIPKYKLNKDWLEEIRKSIPRLGYQRKEEYMTEYGLSNYDATILVKEKKVSDYFEDVLSYSVNPKSASNWITSIILGHINKYELEIDQIFVTPKMLADLIKLESDGKISSKQAKEVLYKALTEEKEPVKIVEESGISQIGDENEIRKICEEVMTENPTAKEQYAAGKTNILDFLVGQVMKKTRGKANPASTRTIMQELIK